MKIYRMNKGSWGKVRAFFDIQTDDGFIIKGLRLVDGINGKFVAMPSQKGQDGEYYDTVLADKDLKDNICQLALQEYGQTYDPNFSNSYSSVKIESESQAEVAAPDILSDDDLPF